MGAFQAIIGSISGGATFRRAAKGTSDGSAGQRGGGQEVRSRHWDMEVPLAGTPLDKEPERKFLPRGELGAKPEMLLVRFNLYAVFEDDNSYHQGKDSILRGNNR